MKITYLLTYSAMCFPVSR